MSETSDILKAQMEHSCRMPDEFTITVKRHPDWWGVTVQNGGASAGNGGFQTWVDALEWATAYMRRTEEWNEWLSQQADASR